MTLIYFSGREVPEPALSLRAQAVQPRRRQRSDDLSAVSNGMVVAVGSSSAESASETLLGGGEKFR